MKILFMNSNPRIEASVRFRVFQFLEHLNRAGHESVVSTFFAEEGSWPLRVLRGVGRRVRDVVRARAVDRVFVHREILPMALNDFVRALPPAVPMIFDLDDAVYLPTYSGWRARVAMPASTKRLAERSAVVYAGNQQLAEYAARWCANVQIVPTVVDTDVFVPVDRRDRETPVIGWIGSPSTSKYLSKVLEVLDVLAETNAFVLRIIGAGRPFALRNAKVENLSWTLAHEVRAFQDLDVGIYPLEDDEWSRGKSGFKAIQYMACGVPFVVSPVGAVRELVRDGQEGLWASTEAEWLASLRRLLVDADLRRQLGEAGRRRAVTSYSVQALAPRWVEGILAAGKR